MSIATKLYVLILRVEQAERSTTKCAKCGSSAMVLNHLKDAN